MTIQGEKAWAIKFKDWLSISIDCVFTHQAFKGKNDLYLPFGDHFIDHYQY